MLAGGMMQRTSVAAMREQAEEAGALLRLLSNPNRLLILCFLAEGEASVADIEAGLGIRQPNLSQQLAEIRNAGVIEARRDAKSVFYRLTDGRAAMVVSLLHRLFCGEDAVAPPRAEGLERPATRRGTGEAAVFATVQTTGDTA